MNSREFRDADLQRHPELRAGRDQPYGGSVSIYMLVGNNKQLCRDNGGTYGVVENTDGEIATPLVRLPLQHAQQLMDDLYSTGLRPSEAAGSAGAAAATQEHLKDLRKMLFDDPRTRPMATS